MIQLLLLMNMNVRRIVVTFLLLLGIGVLLFAPQGTEEGALLIAVGVFIELMALSLRRRR